MLSDPHGTNPLTERKSLAARSAPPSNRSWRLEKVYAECFAYELREHELAFETERLVPLIYKGLPLEARVLTHLKLTGLPVGLLINCNVPVLVDGVTRLVNPLLPVPPDSIDRGREGSRGRW